VKLEELWLLLVSRLATAVIEAKRTICLKMRTITGLTCATLLWHSAAAAADWTADQVFTTRMEPKTFTSAGPQPNKVQYLIYLPKGYQTNMAARWPMMLYLHGAGERTDNVFGVTWQGPPKLVRKGHDFPFIIVAPLCPPKQWWSDTKLLHLLEGVQNEYRVDTNRVYLTGMSMGGSGAWSLGLKYPQYFAAIAPICGNSKPDILEKLPLEQAERIKSLPIWVFHGAKDPTVPVAASERMVKALKKLGCSEVNFTRYPNADHDSWTATYDTANIYQWFLKQQRKS
jgi:predicted peptidase